MSYVHIPKDELHRLYFEDCLTQRQIAGIYGCCKETIGARMREHGIPSRAMRERKLVQSRSKYNPDFFKRWSPEMAWVLGLMLSDGYIGKRSGGSMLAVLVSQDRDMLEQVATISHISPNIPYYPYQTAHRLTIGATEVCQDLISLGCVPRKSLVVRFPTVPPACLSHFIRGLWDGDGHIRVRQHARPGYNKWLVEMGYSSASPNLIQSLVDSLQETLGIQASVYRGITTAGNPHWQIRLFHRDSLRFAHWLYQDSTPLTRLKRKFDMIEPFLNAS